MRRITFWGLSTISALVLLFSYHTSTNQDGSVGVVAESDSGADTGDTTGGTGADTDTDQSDDGAASSDGATDSESSTTTGAGTYTGDAVTTRYGDVQVKITVEDGRITASEVTQVPWSNHRDQEINAQAVPILNAEAVDAQSADIDLVSGATYTSEGYIGSLQSAIDQANL